MLSNALVDRRDGATSLRRLYAGIACPQYRPPVSHASEADQKALSDLSGIVEPLDVSGLDECDARTPRMHDLRVGHRELPARWQRLPRQPMLEATFDCHRYLIIHTYSMLWRSCRRQYLILVNLLLAIVSWLGT